MTGEALLQVRGLSKAFAAGGWSPLEPRRGRQPAPVVEHVSFDVARGETFGLVGESGCGKSTIARCVLRLLRPSGGTVTFDGIDLAQVPASELRRLRRRMQIVFQDPFASLDPRMSAAQLVGESLVIHRIGSREQVRAEAERLLELVGVPASSADRLPHEFSGGQRQRIAIARALMPQPDFVVLDEPVSALDVSIQAQVVNLLRELQRRFHLTYLFIVHDLAVAEHFCDRIAVLYLGRIVEQATTDALFHRPQHPYTVALLSAVPVPDPRAKRLAGRIVLMGEPPSHVERVRGCPFRSRCPVGRDRAVCAEQAPPLQEREPGHWAACHFPGELRDPRGRAALG